MEGKGLNERGRFVSGLGNQSGRRGGVLRPGGRRRGGMGEKDNWVDT